MVAEGRSDEKLELVGRWLGQQLRMFGRTEVEHDGELWKLECYPNGSVEWIGSSSRDYVAFDVEEWLEVDGLDSTDEVDLGFPGGSGCYSLQALRTRGPSLYRVSNVGFGYTWFGSFESDEEAIEHFRAEYEEYFYEFYEEDDEEE